MDVSFSLLKGSVWVNRFIRYVYQIETDLLRIKLSILICFGYIFIDVLHCSITQKCATQTNACIN